MQSSLLTPARPPGASLGGTELVASASDRPPRLEPLPSVELGVRQNAQQRVPLSSPIIRNDMCQENMV